jgi:hypothetical protein
MMSKVGTAATPLLDKALLVQSLEKRNRKEMQSKKEDTKIKNKIEGDETTAAFWPALLRPMLVSELRSLDLEPNHVHQ